ncbi:carboxylesterase/lipase family protein [Marinobacterium mangrovicola]|uniref:Carboxylic ester hydrolase n=1 Tax=Marinobacterium mangrovicola TaxID=1476959 RepID=A0A4V2PD81_9GAMM|nr:carboxylesterase/lipase family protein [Marinobacterium mangrovicola]TCK04146.1 para-nitrobenzyl esterase [Marinobacterium mangrovicola]
MRPLSSHLPVLPLALAFTLGMNTAQAATQVHAPAGNFTGKAVDKTIQYQGIPFAKPPVGELRWAAPEPVEYLDDYQATRFQSICTQPGSMFGGSLESVRGSEDCLYLNVYVPRIKEKGEDKLESLPVMVWIHGGGFVTGSSDQFDPTRLTENQQVISVSMNYRMGPLGYLSHPQLGDASGNFGSLDQQLAMQWVKDNIESFGGDPDNITIFGESAGGMSVGTQMLMPSSRGLFQKAILQSGPFLSGSLLKKREQADAQGETYAKNSACPENSAETLSCLRALPADKAVITSGSANGVQISEWGPTYETPLVPKTAMDALASGDFNQVPVINGSNSDEGNLFAYYFAKGGMAKDYASLKSMLEFQYGPAKAAEILEAYPWSHFPSAASLYGRIMTDSMFACQAYTTSKMLADQVPVYAYEFSDQDAPILLPPSNAISQFGAYHAADIVYVFQTDFDLAKPEQLTPEQQALADQFQRYWANFARTGTPNSANDPHWKQASSEGLTYMDLNSSGVSNRAGQAFSQAHRCELWSSLR